MNALLRIKIDSVQILVTLLIMVSNMHTNYSQDLEQLGKAKLLKITGGVAANTVFYQGDANRVPFTYFLNGNINLNISEFYNLPFSFSYSNQKFASSNPFSFNRLSFHPSYKWVATHIGDVSMSFSPYTLSGHQFTGFGADLSPEGAIKFSMMYGRLLKASEYNQADPQSEPAYKRMGYGFKTTYTQEKYELGVILFKATDVPNSIKNSVPVALELQPKENVVASLQAKVKLYEKLNVDVEYAASVITQDSEADGEPEKSSVLNALLDTNASTQSYKAYNAHVTYQVAQGTVGVGYEYVAPEYRTFGAYFFNNDLENITLNASQTIFDGKIAIAVNAGVQRDDLDNTKSSQLQRIVSAANITYTPSEKLNIAGSYSNFQSYTNIKNQFDYINEVVPQSSNLDTLDFQQISQNASLNSNYIFKDTQSTNQNLNLDLSYQEATSRQGGEVTQNGDSKFYNASTAYTIGYPERSLTLSAAFNASYSTIGVDDSFIFGPSISANKKFFEKKLRTTAAISYNQSQSNGIKEAAVTNMRIGSSYSLKKKHNFSLNLLSQFRTTTTSNQDFTTTFGYNYVFDTFDPKIRLAKRKKKESPLGTALIQFKYRDSVYEKTQGEINRQLLRLQNHPQFAYIPQYKKEGLTKTREGLATLNKIEVYKLEAIQFLEELYSYEDFLKGYHELVFSILTALRSDMKRLDYAFEKSFVRAKIAVDNHSLHHKTDQQRAKATPQMQQSYREKLQSSEDALARLIGHRWMLPIIEGYNTVAAVENPDDMLKAVMTKEKDTMFQMKDEGKPAPEIELYLITKIIDFYWKESLKHTNPNEFELKYINNK